jgi:hypothetical protein
VLEDDASSKPKIGELGGSSDAFPASTVTSTFFKQRRLGVGEASTSTSSSRAVRLRERPEVASGSVAA